LNSELLLPYQGKVVKINRGGPEAKEGLLLEVSSDYLTLLTKDEGLIYYSHAHIKSVTSNAKSMEDWDLEIPEDFTFKRGSSFVDLVNNLKHMWVKINRGGPEAVEGVLEGADNNFVTIINNEQVINMSTFHIKSISYGLKLESTEEENNNDNNDSSNDNVKVSSNNRKKMSNKQKVAEIIEDLT
jgi:spore coat protein B